MNKRLAIVAALAAFLLVAIIGSLLVPIQHPGPKSVTSAIIAECVIGIMRHELAHGITAAEELGSTNESSAINEVVAGWLRGDAWVSNSLRFSSNSPPLLVDGWGKPLNFVQRSHADDRYSAALLAMTNSVLIWSCGSNLSNEYGRGDDIMFDTNATIRAQTLGLGGGSDIVNGK